jgi:hypothetical protein
MSPVTDNLELITREEFSRWINVIRVMPGGGAGSRDEFGEWQERAGGDFEPTLLQNHSDKSRG